MGSLGQSTTFDRERILDFLLHHMTQETRTALMRELPQAYNRLCGIEVVTVIRNYTGEPA